MAFSSLEFKKELISSNSLLSHRYPKNWAINQPRYKNINLNNFLTRAFGINMQL